MGSTPLANLSNTLQADLEKIWAGLSKVCINFDQGMELREANSFSM